VYYVGRELAGRLCGCAAALFLISHHGFRLYSQKIMSEVPALFLVTLVLALLFYAHKHPLRHWPYFGVGLAVGLAMIVRSENILLALPIALLAAGRFIKIDLRRAALLLLGALPWLMLQALYNNTYYGSPLRTGYHWIGWFVEPSFALHNATAHGYWTLTRHYPEQFAARMDGNFLLTMKTFLNQVDQSLAFSIPVVNNGPRQVYRILVVLRTLLGFTGLAFCLCWAGKQISAKAFGLWFAVVAITTLIFYTFFSWQEERYIMRLLPLLCILDGLGVAGILTAIRRWPAVIEAEAGFLATFAIAAVPVLMAGMSAAGMVYRGDDNLLLYEAMHSVGGMIETNAIIVSDWDPVRIEIHMVRGTARSMIPLAKRFGYDRWPQDNAPAVPMYPFAAAEQPEQLMALMQRGRPAYVLLRDPFDLQPSPPELQQLSQHWDLQPLATFNTPQGQSIGHYLFRLQPRASALSLQ
jgi:4-amino-4-deoxy-L-arabinose transferase-like glycosyltransferase